MKKTIMKIIITVASLILFMMILPWLAIEFGDGWAVTGLWMFAFFTVNPALVIGLSIMAGTELRKLWWIPLAISALVPAALWCVHWRFCLGSVRLLGNLSADWSACNARNTLWYENRFEKKRYW